MSCTESFLFQQDREFCCSTQYPMEKKNSHTGIRKPGFYTQFYDMVCLCVSHISFYSLMKLELQSSLTKASIK